MTIILIIVGIILLFMVIIPIILYNTLIAKKNQVENVFGSLDAMLKKRYDLIPNLVSSVERYMKHEGKILKEITEMRTRGLSGGLSSDERIDLDNRVTKAIGGLMVAVENYPDLKANRNFLQLQRALNETEEQISAARRAYNATVTDYNNSIEMFPTNIMATRMKYLRKKVFEIPEAERGNVDIKNLFESEEGNR